MGEKNESLDRWYKRGKDLLQEIADSRPQAGEVYIWFAGQHGFIINIGGLVLYIDVILNDLLDEKGLSRRVYPPPFDPGEIQRVDYVFCTHNHADHLNLETLLPLAKANPHVHFVVPAPCKRLLIEAGIAADRVIAARAGESLDLSPVSLVPVPAIHTWYIQDDGEKDENGDYTSLCYVIKSNGISMYHSGDTWVTPVLLDALNANAPLDIAMLPINGTDWERTGRACIGNMNIQDTVKLARTMSVDLVIPSHYDMMAYNSENPARFVDSMYASCPEKRFHILALGERFIYKKD